MMMNAAVEALRCIISHQNARSRSAFLGKKKKKTNFTSTSSPSPFPLGRKNPKVCTDDGGSAIFPLWESYGV